jgi:hypothetical protein
MSVIQRMADPRLAARGQPDLPLVRSQLPLTIQRESRPVELHTAQQKSAATQTAMGRLPVEPRSLPPEVQRQISSDRSFSTSTVSAPAVEQVWERPSRLSRTSGESVQRTPVAPSQAESGARRAQTASLPLAKLRTGSTQTVQREESPAPTTNSSTARANGASQETTLPVATVVTKPVDDQEEEGINSDDREDLDDVAKAILPLVKRLLTLERERRSFR